MANKGHYANRGGTRQGIYVCTPEGELLSSINSLNPDHVFENILIGLDKWNKLSPKIKNTPDHFDPVPDHRWENSYPESGTVLKCTKVDLLSDPPSESERADRWNMDHVWFNSDETRLWIKNNIKVGDSYNLPKIITDRFFRFHLVDNVRGQTLPFAPQEIKESIIKMNVENIKDNIIQFRIEGQSKAIANGPWLLGENDWTPNHELNHSITTKLLGSASYNQVSKSFLEFEMVGIGERVGKTQNNGRKNSPEESHIGFLFELAGKKKSDKIAPAFVDLYNADWISRPIVNIN